MGHRASAETLASSRGKSEEILVVKFDSDSECTKNSRIFQYWKLQLDFDG